MRILTISVAIAASVIGLAFRPSYERTDFSGKWELNITKTTKENGPRRLMQKTLQIEQSKNMMKTATTFRGTTVTITYTFDGKKTETIKENTKQSATVSWSSDQGEFTISYLYFV